MPRLLAILTAALLTLGAAACEAPGAPDGTGNNTEDAGGADGSDIPEGDALEEDAGDTSLDSGGGPAGLDDDAEGGVGGAGQTGDAATQDG
jgi:hypothetical protein